MQNNIYIDFDGVIIDSQERLEKIKENTNLSWDELLTTINWELLLQESNSVNNSVETLRKVESKGLKYHILTKVDTISEMQDKIDDIRNNRKLNAPIIFCPKKRKKSNIIIPTSNCVLIDDREKHYIDWKNDGGIAILFDAKNNMNSQYSKINTLEDFFKTIE